MQPVGIEPTSTVLQTAAMTTSARVANFTGFHFSSFDETIVKHTQSRLAPSLAASGELRITMRFTMVGLERIELSYPLCKSGVLPLN